MTLLEGRLPPRVELETAPGVWMRFALIPSGRFTMGSPREEWGRKDIERQHKVIISKPYYMAQTCVTQEQYAAVMGANPSYFKGAKRPVDSVSWDEAMEFCRRASQRTGRSVLLPTEAQWEYACRAGSTTPFNTGGTLPRNMARYEWGGTYPSNRVRIWIPGSVAVGSFPPNAWGLYDMHGNAYEWCYDYYALYPAGDAVDPTGWAEVENDSSHVLRGGSWSDDPQNGRAACRLRLPPGLGFRCLLYLP